MNNQSPSMGQQLIRSLLLSFAAMWLISTFFGWPGQQKNNATARDPKLEAKATLDNAFVGLGAPAASTSKTTGTAAASTAAGASTSTGTLITPAKAKAEVESLQKEIAANDSDKYAYWARLRAGLLQQYVLKQPEAALKNYTDVINHAAHDAVDAQAIYQKGDWQWHTAAQNKSTLESGAPAPTQQEAATTLETILYRSKQYPEITSTEIFIPNLPAADSKAREQAAAAAISAIPAAGFRKAKISSLRGDSLQNPDPQGVLDRVNIYYSSTWTNKLMDTLVNATGAVPSYSYGLAIVFLAIVLRIVMQPINRRQYDSMKGMAVLGPEMKKIQEKYKAKPSDSPEVARDKQMKSFQEVRQLQKDNGVNPQLGCALMFVQLPIFFYFINPLMMHYEPKMDLVGASFGWIPNLARPEYILLGLYGLSMLVSFRLSATPPTDEMQKQLQVMTTWVMPIMLPFFMKGFSSAFILYWMAFNIISMIFQYRMMKGSDPNKNVWKTLLGKTDAPPQPAVATIAPRPKKSGVKTPRTLKDAAQSHAADATKVKSIAADEPIDGTAEANGTNAKAKNGAANGHGKANGKGASEIEMDTRGAAGQSGKAGSDASGGGNTAGSGSAGSAAQRARRRRRY
jgi:YidC/Oxa1 family membrane protein insertase